MATAVQSVTPNQLLDTIQFLLVNGNGKCPSPGINEAYIVESYSDYRPRSAEPFEVTFGLIAEEPEMYSGAGRLGHDTFWTLEITLFVRLELDPAGSDAQWSRDQQYGGLVVRTKINDIFLDNFLYSAYDPVTFYATGVPITLEGLQQLRSPKPTKPDRESTAGGEDVTYGEFKLYYSIKTVSPLTV